MTDPATPAQPDIDAAAEVYCFDDGLQASGTRDTIYRASDGRYIHVHERMNDWDFEIVESRHWIDEDEKTKLQNRLEKDRKRRENFEG